MTSQQISSLDENATWAAIDREREDLADLLDSLSPQQWSHPSLCADWRVRDVAAHLALAQMGKGEAALSMLRAGGSFDRMVRDTARRHASASTTQLTAEIRAMVGSRRHAPGITHLEPLIDVLVHGQDIAVPLGLTRTMPVEAAVTAATRVWTVGLPLSLAFRARSRLRGLHLVATDTDWSVGEGEPVEGPIAALLMLLAGRTALLGQLSGKGVERLSGPRPS
jgi:uncharacterized protein (TIGR03083 family)